MILKVVFTLDIRWVLIDDRHPGVLFTACAGGCLELGCWFRYVGDHMPGPHGIVIGLIAVKRAGHAPTVNCAAPPLYVPTHDGHSKHKVQD